MHVNFKYLYQQHMMNQLSAGLVPQTHPGYQETLTRHQERHQERLQERLVEMQKSVHANLSQLKPYDLAKSALTPVRYNDTDQDNQQPEDLSVRYPAASLQSLQYPSVYIKREPSPSPDPASPPPTPCSLVPVKSEPDDPGYRTASGHPLGHLYHGPPPPDLVRSYSLPARDPRDHGDMSMSQVSRQVSLDRDKRQQDSTPGPSEKREKEEVNSSRTIIGTIKSPSNYYKDIKFGGVYCWFYNYTQIIDLLLR